MERAIGEVFDFNEVKLQVKDARDSHFCYGCYFNGIHCLCDEMRCPDQAGECFRIRRTDDRNVIFVEVE